MPEVQQVEPPAGKQEAVRTQPRWMDWLPTARMTLLSILVALVFGAILIAISDDRVVGAASFGDAITGLYPFRLEELLKTRNQRVQLVP